MSDDIIKAPGEISKATTMNNDSCRLWLDLAENLPAELVAKFITLKGKPCWLAVLPTQEREITALDVVDLPESLPVPSSRQGSLSQRLRNSLFGYWSAASESGLVDKDFEVFRKRIMEQEIDGWRQRAEELRGEAAEDERTNP